MHLVAPCKFFDFLNYREDLVKDSFDHDSYKMIPQWKVMSGMSSRMVVKIRKPECLGLMVLGLLKGKVYHHHKPETIQELWQKKFVNICDAILSGEFEAEVSDIVLCLATVIACDSDVLGHTL